MKQHHRGVRISFLLCLILALVAFPAGFYYGFTQTRQENLIFGTESDLYSMDHPLTNSKEEYKQINSVESMTTFDSDKYYLMQNGNVVSVYKGASREVYFDTDLNVEDLPEALRKQLADGIEFDNLEGVYGFLENYSS